MRNMCNLSARIVQETMFRNIKSNMKNGVLSFDAAFDLLEISETERMEYRTAIENMK